MTEEYTMVELHKIRMEQIKDFIIQENAQCSSKFTSTEFKTLMNSNLDEIYNLGRQSGFKHAMDKVTGVFK